MLSLSLRLLFTMGVAPLTFLLLFLSWDEGYISQDSVTGTVTVPLISFACRSLIPSPSSTIAAGFESEFPRTLPLFSPLPITSYEVGGWCH